MEVKSDFQPCANEPDRSPNSVPLVSDLDREEKDQLYQKLDVYEKGYTLGVLSFTLNMVFLLRLPQFFWVWHLVKAFIFLPWRFARFYRRNMEWYMMDFCYFVTYMTVIGCAMAFIRIATGFDTLISTYNYAALRAGFGFTNGALLMAVPMFGNKIVFHDVDNTTSLYIHLSPALMAWTLRWGGGYGTSLIEAWWPNMFHICEDMQEADVSVTNFMSALWYTGPCQGKLQEFAVGTLFGWIVFWGVPFYLIVFCCLKGYLDRRPEKQFLFRDCVKDTKGMFRYLSHLPESLQPLGYMLGHLLWTFTAGCLSVVLWNSFVLHTTYLAVIFLYAVHNGSTFMFRVVATRNMQNVVKKVTSQKTQNATASASPTGYDLLQAQAPDALEDGKAEPSLLKCCTSGSLA